MNLKYKIIFGFIVGFLLSNTVRTHIKLYKAEAQILDLKARNAAVESMKEIYRSAAWQADRRDAYGYWYEYVDMKERVDSLTEVIKKLK
jgi:hypothetical protein